MTQQSKLDELAHAGAEHLDPAFVAGYQRKQGYGRPGGPDPGADVAALRAHGLTESATVVDLGAGTGRFTLAAACTFQRVIAVDVSPVARADAHSDRLRHPDRRLPPAPVRRLHLRQALTSCPMSEVKRR